MAVTIEVLSSAFKLTGDGVSAQANLSWLAYPFPARPPGNITGAFINADGAGLVTAVTVVGSVLVLSLSSAFSGQSTAIQIGLNFEVG